VFARYFVELPIDAGTVERGLVSDPDAWVPALARTASAHGEQLLTEVGFGREHRVATEVEISFGEPVRIATKTILPMSWAAAASPRLFPALEADLEVAALGPSRAQLSMSARYAPPFGALGRALDRALLHRVAEATLKDFLDRVGRALVERLEDAATANG